MADADLSMPPHNLDRFFDAVARSSSAAQIAIGSREAPGSRRVNEPWPRHIVGRVFNWIVRAVAVRGISDTQCGFKLFSREAVDALFPHAILDGFAFDVELLFLARRAGVEIQEVGIEWHHRRRGHVSVRKGAAAFVDILRVRWYGWSGRYSRLRDTTHLRSRAPAQRPSLKAREP